MQRKLFLITLAVIVLISGIVLADRLILTTETKTGLKDPYLYLSLGDFLLKNGYAEQALAAYEKAFSLDPENKVILNNTGLEFAKRFS